MPSGGRAALVFGMGGLTIVSLDFMSRYAPRAQVLLSCVPFTLVFAVASLAWALGAEDDPAPVVNALWSASAYCSAAVVLLLQWAVASRALSQHMSAGRAVLVGFVLALVCWLLIVCGIFRFAG